MKSHRFVVTNWFAWILEANNAGYSKADILFVLQTVGVLDGMREVLAKSDAKE